MKTNKLILCFLLPGLMSLQSCKKVEKEMAVSTGEPQNVLATTANVTGEIIDLGEGATQYGHCFSTTQNPTVSLLTKTEKGIPVIGKYTSTLTNLSPSTKYYVKAYISRGSDVVYGSEINFTTAALTTPGAPTSVIATAGNAQASVTFTAPVSNGGSPITGYTATSSPGGLTGTSSESPVTVLGLTNGTAYTFTVTASNANGTGPASSPSNSVTPSSSSTVPGAPTSVVATAGNAQATVTFVAPVNNGGSPITGYTVTSSPSGFTGNGSASPITVTGLANGTAYTFTVTATNVNGTGPASSASNSVTPSTSLTAPGAPTGVSAVAGYERATVTFAAPTSDGGSAITGYTATSSPGGFTGTGTASPITVTGLPALIAYTFTVTATNVIGTGPASSASNSVTPTTVPDAPIIGTATAGNAQASVTFTAPASDGGSSITGYTVTSSPGSFTSTGSASPITVTGLSILVAYTFTVTATNANGTGPASAASNSVTPTTVPGAPTIGTATKGNAQASVTFSAPASDGGSAITGYTVTSSPGNFAGIGSASPVIVTGLTNGTAYTFTVVATNINGNSTSSSASNSVIPSTIPGAPTSVVATEGNAQAAVTFAAPNDGGSAITGYTVTSSPGSITGTGSSTTIIVTGLTNGTPYTFKVTATNANGPGPASSASNSVTPSTVPGPPTSVVATAGNAQATVTFTAPASNGGSPITGYTVTSSPGSITGSGSASPITVTGLINYTAYTFTVVATNINGNSAPSSASNSVTPIGVITNPTTGRIWMDRNLGASQVATSSMDAASYGDLYQWGRAADGHQVRTSGTTTTLSSSDTPGHGNFILVSASPYDWRSPQNDNLWQGVSGTNNPCPAGYRLPTKAEWMNELLSWSTGNADGAFASPLKLPMSGYRIPTTGSLSSLGSVGHYWSSTKYLTSSEILFFYSSDAGYSEKTRTYGLAVRCIKD